MNPLLVASYGVKMKVVDLEHDSELEITKLANHGMPKHNTLADKLGQLIGTLTPLLMNLKELRRAIPLRALAFAGSSGALFCVGLEMLLLTISPTEYVMWRETRLTAAVETILLLTLAVFQLYQAIRGDELMRVRQRNFAESRSR